MPYIIDNITANTINVKDTLLINGVPVSGGYKNIICNNTIGATIGGGGKNIISGCYSFIGGGRNNTASNYYSSVVGGLFNTASGYKVINWRCYHNNVFSDFNDKRSKTK
jgi:hypothetical protein